MRFGGVFFLHRGIPISETQRCRQLAPATNKAKQAAIGTATPVPMHARTVHVLNSTGTGSRQVSLAVLGGRAQPHTTIHIF